MPRYTDQQEFTYLQTPESLALVVDVGTGGLVVESFNGVDYVQTDDITDSGAFELYVSGQSLRFTPSSGCSYTIERGV